MEEWTGRPVRPVNRSSLKKNTTQKQKQKQKQKTNKKKERKWNETQMIHNDGIRQDSARK